MAAGGLGGVHGAVWSLCTAIWLDAVPQQRCVLLLRIDVMFCLLSGAAFGRQFFVCHFFLHGYTAI
jgi:hypothetical protein